MPKRQSRVIMSTVIFVLSVLGVLGGTLAQDAAVRCKPRVCGINEVSTDCYNECQRTCKNRIIGDGRVCTLACTRTGCVCKPGTLRHDNGTCVPEGQCSPPDCPKGEIYTTCGSSCPTTCETRGDTCKVCPAVCVEGCFCAGKTIRAPNGTCVEPRKCPPRTCGPNEEFVDCPPTCPPTEDCSNLWSRIDCSNPIDCCKPSCRCKTGFYRNAENKCISSQACTNSDTRCSDPNAITRECAPNEACRPTCAQPTPGPCPRNCVVNGCECPPGLVLSKRGGRCIKIEDCPLTNATCNGDPNAIIKANPLACPSTCDAPNAAPLCKKLGPAVGCECKPGYIRSKDGGTCILPDQCPGGNPCGRNETYVSCKVNCPSNYCPVNNSPNTVICETPNPCYSGCVCKINYRRTSVKDPVCRYASECPPVKCDKNEKWSGCPSACLAEDCDNVNDRPVTCNTLLLNCQPKCICKMGYFRDKNRKCIPAKHCPKPIKCKTNEVFNPCRIKCPPQTCASIYSDYDCSKVNTECEPGCDCISGFLRNGTETDLCIPSKLCPPPKPVCGSNEHYEINRNKCELSCKNKDRPDLIGHCPPTSGCFCDVGFVRNNNGICVKPQQCPKPNICPKNEVLSECYNTCLTTCRTRIRSDGRACHTACIDSGCVCKSGFLRHDNGTCVPVSECSPPQCNENETYSRCGTACPPTCQNRGDNCTVCTDQCVEDCFCSKGFVRADDGTCVKPKDCPLRTCKNSNEIFVECPPSCPATDGCSLLWSKFNCTGAVRCCKPQCRCEPGLFRGPSGVCITAQQCI